MLWAWEGIARVPTSTAKQLRSLGDSARGRSNGTVHGPETVGGSFPFRMVLPSSAPGPYAPRGGLSRAPTFAEAFRHDRTAHSPHCGRSLVLHCQPGWPYPTSSALVALLQKLARSAAGRGRLEHRATPDSNARRSALRPRAGRPATGWAYGTKFSRLGKRVRAPGSHRAHDTQYGDLSETSGRAVTRGGVRLGDAGRRLDGAATRRPSTGCRWRRGPRWWTGRGRAFPCRGPEKRSDIRLSFCIGARSRAQDEGSKARRCGSLPISWSAARTSRRMLRGSCSGGSSGW